MFRIFKRERAQSEDPSSEAELKDRGNRFLAKGELREAENCYRLAIVANADSAVCHLNLGFVLNEQGRRDEAAHALRQAVALDPAQMQTVEVKAVHGHEQSVQPHHAPPVRIDGTGEQPEPVKPVQARGDDMSV